MGGLMLASVGRAQDALEILLRDPLQPIAAEYFIDRDPGTGAGSPIELTGGSELEEFTFSTGSLKLAPGAHDVYLRFQDQHGHWGHPTRYPFFVMPYGFQQATQIQGGELFFNSDPGRGKGTPFTIAGDGPYRAEAEVTLKGVKPGGHQLYYRFQDSRGEWLAPERRSVFARPVLEATHVAWRIRNDERALGEGWSAVTPLGDGIAVARSVTEPLASDQLGEWRLETQILLNGGIPWMMASVPFEISEAPPMPAPPLPGIGPVEVVATLKAPPVVGLGVELTLSLGEPIEQPVLVEQSANLSTWFPLGVIPAGESELAIRVDVGNRFFRIVPVAAAGSEFPPLPPPAP